MKRLICWIRGHKGRTVIFMSWYFTECSRCGKVGLATIGGSGTAAHMPLPKEKVRW